MHPCFCAHLSKHELKLVVFTEPMSTASPLPKSTPQRRVNFLLVLPPGLLELPATVAIYEVLLIAGHSIFAMAVAVEDALEALVEVAAATVGEGCWVGDVSALHKVSPPCFWYVLRLCLARRKEDLPKSCRDARLRQLQVILGIVKVLLAHS